MSTAAHCTPEPRAVPELPPHLVSLFVADTHPLLQLKRALDWPALQAVMVRHGGGRKKRGRHTRPALAGRFVCPLVGLDGGQSPLGAADGRIQRRERGGARVFGPYRNPLPHLRDHSNIARAQAALGTAGWQQINHLVVTEAVRLGFGKPQLLSADTTVQEPQIGYPHEAGILRGIAQRVYRAAVKLKNRGYQHAQAAIEKAKEVFGRVKDYHLFAKTKHAKDQALKKILSHSKQLITSSRQVIKQVGVASTKVAHAAVAKLQQMGEVSGVLIPQIEQWMKTGKVARHKILHPGITQARSIVKKSAGKKVAFGLKWLLNRIPGGIFLAKSWTRVSTRERCRSQPCRIIERCLGSRPARRWQSTTAAGVARRPWRSCKRLGSRRSASSPPAKPPGRLPRKTRKRLAANAGRPRGASGPSRAANTNSEGADSAATRAREQPGSVRWSV